MSPRVALTPACFPGGGGGHVVRCLALARALENAGAECTFVVEPLGADLLGRLGWTGEVTAARDEAARLAAIHALKPEATVVDDYRLDGAFESMLFGTVMVIDDFTDRHHACDLLLDSAYGRTVEDYQEITLFARTLLGPQYALLRDGFALRRQPEPVVERVFVCFGLSDVGGIAERAVRLLRPLAAKALFDVALASDAPSAAPLLAMARSDPGLSIHLDADVAPLMRAADLGVGAGGGMVWERRAAGLPQLVVTVAENQRPMAERLAADGIIAAVDLDDPAFDHGLQRAFATLLDLGERRAQINRPGADCDGLGAHRAARALLEVMGG